VRIEFSFLIKLIMFLAVVTAHNIIIIHNHLIRFPDIGFFVSPIPLHIAAMVILYGHINKSMRLRKSMVIQDIWMALDVLPRMRWRWQRKDINGEHPLIANLAERVLEINLRDIVPSGDQMLLSELDWDSHASLMSPSMAVHKQEQMTPVITNAQFPSHGTNYGQSIRGSAPSNGHGNGMINNHQLDNKQPLMEVPSGLFYPFFPERKLVPNRNDHPQDFSEMLAAAGAQAGGPYGHDSYIGEDDVAGVQMWMPQASYIYPGDAFGFLTIANRMVKGERCTPSHQLEAGSSMFSVTNCERSTLFSSTQASYFLGSYICRIHSAFLFIRTCGF
jgi:hypothetical protein